MLRSFKAFSVKMYKFVVEKKKQPSKIIYLESSFVSCRKRILRQIEQLCVRGSILKSSKAAELLEKNANCKDI